MNRILPVVIVGVVVVLVLVALVTGATILLVPAAVLAVLGGAIGVLAGRAVAPGDEPGRPVGDETALGDTAQAHDEINPHDIPKDAPERKTAEHLADEREHEQVQRRSSPGPASGG